MTTITTELRKALMAATPGERHFDDNLGLVVTSDNPRDGDTAHMWPKWRERHAVYFCLFT